MYDINYFLGKANSIPEENWISGRFKDFEGGMCINGHCGSNGTCSVSDESEALENILKRLTITLVPSAVALKIKLIYPMSYSIAINDGQTNEYQQDTPKKRITAALQDVKKLIEAEKQPTIEAPKEKIKYIVKEVDSAIKKMELILS